MRALIICSFYGNCEFMTFLLGKPLAERIQHETAHIIKQLPEPPSLAVVLVGDDPGSEIYVRLKGKAAQALGIRFSLYSFLASAQPEEVLTVINQLNTDPKVHGIITQLPLPTGWDTDALIASIDPAKDADGFHQVTLEQYLAGDEVAIPVLPRAIQELILAPHIDLNQKLGVVIVNSNFFGRVIRHTLERLGLRVVIVPREMVASAKETLAQAQVVVSVCGEPGILQLSQLHPSAIVVDAGITRVREKVLGDIAGSKEEYAGWITPLPGGVGPLTIACLLHRTARLAQAQLLLEKKLTVPPK